MQRADSLEKILMLGKIEGRRSGQQRMRWLDDITDSMDMNLSKFQEMVKDRELWYAAVHGLSKSQFRDWTPPLWPWNNELPLQTKNLYDYDLLYQFLRPMVLKVWSWTLASPGNLLKMQILGPCPRFTQSATWEWSPANSFNESS